MFYLVGDYIRMSPDKTGKYHSTVVAETSQKIGTMYNLTILSINRCYKKLVLHSWRLIDLETMKVDPKISYDLDTMTEKFLKDERERKGLTLPIEHSVGLDHAKR